MPSTSLQPRGRGGPGGIDRTDLNVGEDRLIDWPTLDESKILNDKDDAITKKTEIRVREPNQVPFPQRDRARRREPTINVATASNPMDAGSGT